MAGIVCAWLVYQYFCSFCILLEYLSVRRILGIRKLEGSNLPPLSNYSRLGRCSFFLPYDLEPSCHLGRRVTNPADKTALHILQYFCPYSRIDQLFIAMGGGQSRTRTQCHSLNIGRQRINTYFESSRT